MVESTVIKLSAPVARSSLLFLAVGVLATSIAIIYYAIDYPYLFGSDTFEGSDKFFVSSSNAISITFSIYSFGAILVSLSTVYASYKGTSGYTLGNAGLVAIFVPILIATFFLTRPYYHDPKKCSDEGFVSNYRIDNKTKPITYIPPSGEHRDFKRRIEEIVDQIQISFKCCGHHKPKEWADTFNGFTPGSCCELESKRSLINASEKSEWSKFWPGLDKSFAMSYCEPGFYEDMIGCREALHEFEDSKRDRLALLTGILGILCIADCFISLLTYALIHTEHHECRFDETELAVISGDDTPNESSTPTLPSMKPRASISSNSGSPNETAIAARAMAVRFNLSNSPRQSISGPSKFSLAARRQSSYI